MGSGAFGLVWPITRLLRGWGAIEARRVRSVPHHSIAQLGLQLLELIIELHLCSEIISLRYTNSSRVTWAALLHLYTHIHTYASCLQLVSVLTARGHLRYYLLSTSTRVFSTVSATLAIFFSSTPSSASVSEICPTISSKCSSWIFGLPSAFFSSFPLYSFVPPKANYLV